MARIIETSAIECSGDRTMMGATQYLAVLAYPRDCNARDRFIAAIARDAVTQWKIKHQQKRTPSQHRAIAAQMAAQDARVAVERGLDLIRYRLDAVTAFVVAGFTGGKISVKHEDMAKPSLYRKSTRSIGPSFTRAIGAAAGKSGLRTFRRQWSDSRTVLHLASAVQPLVQRYPHVFDLIEAAPDWLPTTIRRAEQLRLIFAAPGPARPAILEQIRLIAL